MLIQHPDRNSKKGAALIMVMLSGMLIVILGIGMLFFYQKQVERRMKLEFDIHRRLAAKSGFNLVQYNNGTTGTYVYVVGGNRPAILVTVGEAEPIYAQNFSQAIESNWVRSADVGGTVIKDGLQFKFSTSDAGVGQRNELIFNGTNDVAWNNYPFGLCYDLVFATESVASNEYPWAGYVYVGFSNDWNQVFFTNTIASLVVGGLPGGKRRIGLYEHLSNTGIPAMPTNNSSSQIVFTQDKPMEFETEFYLDKNNMAFGSRDWGYTRTSNSMEFASVTNNIIMGVGGFTLSDATNATLNLATRFEVRPPYEYVIYLSWTNRNRYFGTTNTLYTTSVQATVVDATPDVLKKYYFFDSFETVVP
jgi:hypothetical protein